ncbi:4109_t:CDS:2 [Rhizophagus irregularis]|nr:4109_t:CDS:2 [Rhizophagus irregularis]
MAEYCSDEVSRIPYFLIEWDDAGINARTAINPVNTKMALINLIRGQAGCSPFPQQAPSDCTFAFDNRQNLLIMAAILTVNNWSRRREHDARCR